MTEHPGPLHRHHRTGDQLPDQEAADCAAGVLLRLTATRTVSAVEHEERN